MKERLLQFLTKEGLSATVFADEIGVQRSSISHILSGRNNPSYDFIQKILEKYVNLSADWLLMGRGEMYKTIERKNSDTDTDKTWNISREDSIDIPENKTKKQLSDEFTNVNKVNSIILIYENNTFEVIQKK